MKNEYYIAKEEINGGKVKAYNLKVVRLQLNDKVL